MDIAIDFDGTCVTHEFPTIGKDIGAVPVLKRLTEAGHNLILYTMRSDIEEPKSTDIRIVPVAGGYLTQAKKWFKDNDIPLYGCQCNPSQKSWTTSPKCYAQLYIDDAALGIPLVHNKHSRPYVDWEKVERILIDKGLI